MPHEADNRKDINRLRHMIDAVQECLEFAKGKKEKDLAKDRKLLLSIVKDIEILGEAASKTSIEFQEKHSQIPWREIISMRNRLIHTYFDIDTEVIWQTVSTDLPPLLKELKKI